MISTATIEALEPFAELATKTGAVRREEVAEAFALLRTAAGSTTPAPRPTLETAGQAARRLGVCKETVLRLHRGGQLQGVYVRPGSHKALRFRSSDIDRLATQGAEG